jgi:hypothetical protein
MQVEVGDAVARVRPDIEHEARATLRKTLGGSDAAGDIEHLDDHGPVLGSYARGVDDVLARDDEDVCGRDWADVPEGVDEVAGEHFLRGKLPRRDGTEQASGHRQRVPAGSPLPLPAAGPKAGP